MSFINEKPAFTPANSGIEPVYDKVKRNDPVNSVPPDSGLLHSGTPRKKLTFREAPNNSVIQHYGSYIVMGSDRLGHLGRDNASGFSNSDAIDIVVGRGANLKNTSTEDPTGPPDGFIVGPLPTSDAARIYISSQTNLDKNFGLATAKREGYVGSNKHPLSGIALKADNVRMVARNNIKIVTGRNQGYSGGHEQNTLNGKSPQAGTISLIGGNYTEGQVKWVSLFNPEGAVQSVPYLQPAIKGDNLRNCLYAIFEYIDLVNATLFNSMMIQSSTEAAEIASPISDPIAKAEKIRGTLQRIPFGLQASFENRAWALQQKEIYLTEYGEHNICSPNVYLT